MANPIRTKGLSASERRRRGLQSGESNYGPPSVDANNKPIRFVRVKGKGIRGFEIEHIK